MKKVGLLLTAVALAVGAYALTYPSAALKGSPAKVAISSEKPDTSSLNEKVDTWIRTLSQEKGFGQWKEAKWTSYPLGPGTHGWVIQITKQDTEVGYLIVNVTPDGKYVLSEYGTGENPLFSLKTLYQSMVQQELIPANTLFKDFRNDTAWQIQRMYFSPFAAVWKAAHNQDEPYFFDAKTGELLPIENANMEQQPKQEPLYTLLTEHPVLKKVLRLPSFSPYERLNFVVQPSLKVNTFNVLEKILNAKTKVTFTAKLYNNKVTIPFAVTGYQQWAGGNSYVRAEQAEQDSDRFIPFPAFLRNGHFYK